MSSNGGDAKRVHTIIRQDPNSVYEKNGYNVSHVSKLQLIYYIKK